MQFYASSLCFPPVVKKKKGEKNNLVCAVLSLHLAGDAVFGSETRDTDTALCLLCADCEP